MLPTCSHIAVNYFLILACLERTNKSKAYIGYMPFGPTYIKTQS